MRLLWDHLLTIAGFLLAMALVLRIMGEKRQPGGAMAWLLAIALVPYIGVPLFLLLGDRKLRREVRSKGPLYTRQAGGVIDTDVMTEGGPGMVRAGMPMPRTGNATDLHFSGESAHAALMRLFENARHSINVTTFILGRDETGRSVVELLAKKAREGVEVRLLLDGLGCIRSSGRFTGPLRDAGGRVAEFMPVLPLRRKWSANLRNHRKIAVVDHQAAMIGGMNLATEFMGPEPSDARFVDSAVFVEGPIVADIETVFFGDWKYVTDEAPPKPDSLPGASGLFVPGEATSTLQVVASGPDVPEDTFTDAMLCAIMDARERIWLVTPYFVPDEPLLRTLAVKARAGKDVRVLVPMRSNHRLADLARGPALREIAAAGGRVYAYPKGMVHAKAMVFDSTLAVTGSPNLDMRSMYLNFEIALFHYSRPEIERVASWTAWMQAQSIHYHAEHSGSGRRWAEELCQFISPLL